jgi:hypothetical protein
VSVLDLVPVTAERLEFLIPRLPIAANSGTVGRFSQESAVKPTPMVPSPQYLSIPYSGRKVDRGHSSRSSDWYRVIAAI